MFILRRITSDLLESLEILGDSFHYIMKENHEDFDKALKDSGCSPNNVNGFIMHNSGSKVIPIYKESFYSIMTSNGDTFRIIQK